MNGSKSLLRRGFHRFPMPGTVGTIWVFVLVDRFPKAGTDRNHARVVCRGGGRVSASPVPGFPFYRGTGNGNRRENTSDLHKWPDFRDLRFPTSGTEREPQCSKHIRGELR
jgi:hypothetical protein